jgi:pimeloyl-ACP methyl ester carboxylesterase
MPKITIKDVTLNYHISGQSQQPPLVFTHSLLWDHTMFDAAIAELATDYYIIALDQLGHGESTTRAKITLEDMADYYAQFLQQLELGPVHWAGLSMGGMVGMRLAIQYPQLVRSLILMDTSARPERPEQRESSLPLAEMLRRGQAAEIVDLVMDIFFSPTTLAQQPELVASYRQKLVGYSMTAVENIFPAMMAVFDRRDISSQLATITQPALVIVGEDDIATLPEESEFMAAQLPQAQLVRIAQVGHMSITEAPALVVAEIQQFLQNLS